VTSIKIDIKLSPPRAALKKFPCPAPRVASPLDDKVLLLEKIKHYVELCDNSTPLRPDTKEQWLYLKTLFKNLTAKAKLTDFQDEVYKLISPLVMKFTQDDPDLAGSIEGTDIIKHAAGNQHG
jgi:hypothetical protein